MSADVKGGGDVAKLIAERDEARALVIEANNSLYGSQGYFHSIGKGAFDKYHLAEPIEALKADSRRNWALRADMLARLDADTVGMSEAELRRWVADFKREVRAAITKAEAPSS